MCFGYTDLITRNITYIHTCVRAANCTFWSAFTTKTAYFYVWNAHTFIKIFQKTVFNRRQSQTNTVHCIHVHLCPSGLCVLVNSKHSCGYVQTPSCIIGSWCLSYYRFTRLQKCKKCMFHQQNKSIKQSMFDNLILCCVYKIFMLTVKVIVSIFLHEVSKISPWRIVK